MTVESARRPVWIWVPTAALLAAAAGGFALDFFRGRYDAAPPVLANPTEEQSRQYNDARMASLNFSAGVDAGVAAAVMAGLFGAALGFAAGTLARAVLGLLVGAAVGGGLAYWGGMIGSHFYAVDSTSGRSIGLLRAPVMQLTFWLPVGISVAAAAFAAINGALLARRVAAGAFVGALVSACLVPVANMIVLLATNQDTKDQLPPANLLYCLTMAAVGAASIAAGMLFAVRGRKTSAPVAENNS